jgi:hypothetical protein
MKVILRPLVKDQWSGIIKFRNCHEDLGSYFTRSGRLYTGLTDADAERLGDRLNLDLRTGSEFWKTFFIRTSGKDMILETEDAMDELKYLFLKSHKRVKSSVFEHKATANFVLINEHEEARKSNVHNKAKRQAMRELDKMSTEDIKKALRIYGKRAENLTAEVAENKLFEIVEGDPQGFLNKWVNNETRETQYLIERAIGENIIRRNKRQYSYGTEVIGYGIEDAILYLEDPKNQELRMTIISEIKAKGKLSDLVNLPEEEEVKKDTFFKTDSEKPLDGNKVSEVVDKPEKIKQTKKSTKE